MSRPCRQLIAWLLAACVAAYSLSPVLAAPSAPPGATMTAIEERDRLIAEILELDTKLALLYSEKAAAETRLEQLRGALRSTQQEKSRLLAAAAEEEQNVGRWLRFLVEEGSLTYLDVLLGAVNLADFLNRLDIVVTIIETNVNSLNKLQALTVQIETQAQELSLIHILKHGATGILCLKLVLVLKSSEQIPVVVNRQLGRIRVIWLFVTGCDNIRVELSIQFSQAVTGSFCRRSL